MRSLFGNKTFWLTSGLLLILILWFVYPQTVLTPVQKVKNYLVPEIYQGPLVKIKEVIIPVELATTSEAVARGLSGRASLDYNKGLLFIFPSPYRYRFWMPDMNFPIDILWLDQDKIVDITKEATNIFDPLNPVFYQPNEPALYVLEVNAGFAESHQLKIGDSVEFSNLK